MWLNLYILFGKILHSSHPPLITPAGGALIGEELQDVVQEIRIGGVGHVLFGLGCVCDTPTGNQRGPPATSFPRTARLAPPHRRGGRRREERKFAEEVLHRPHFGIQLEWGAFLTIDTVLEAASPIDQARVDRLAFAVNVVRVGGACRSGLVALTRPRHRRREGVLAGAGTGETD